MSTDTVSSGDHVFPSQVKILDIKLIKPDVNNANTHPSENLLAIQASLRKFGQQKPIVVKPPDEDGLYELVAGEGTWRAMLNIGYTRIAAVVTGLAGLDAKAYGLADNKTAESSEWNWEQLAVLLQELEDGGYEMNSTGFMPHEIEPLLKAQWTPDMDAGPIDDEEDAPGVLIPFYVTSDQFQRIQSACSVLKAQYRGEDELTDGECLASICDRFIRFEEGEDLDQED